MALLFSSFVSAQTLTGTVKNATTGKPAAGDEIVLLKLGEGMEEAGRTKADSKGNFSFKVEDDQSPHLVRAIHQDVTYHRMAPPGTTSVEVDVYDVAKKIEGLEVVADVNESSIGQLHEGQAAEVSVDAFPNQKWKGVLRQIIPTADRAKATVQVKVTIVDPSDRLLPEMSSSVSFLQSERTDAEMHEPARIWIPASAISGGNVAIVGADKHVTLRHVTTGAVREKRIEITGGLNAGDRVVTSAVDTLENGQLIRFE